MASLGIILDTTKLTASQGFYDIPPGDYLMEVVNNKVEDTKDGNGKRLTLQWKVVEGEHEGQSVFQGINFINKSIKAMEIGQGQIKAVADATNFVGIVEDADVLMHIPCWVKIGLDKGSPGYEKKNEVKSVRAYSAQAPATKPQLVKKTQTVQEAAMQGNTVANPGVISGPRTWRKPGATA